MGWMAEKGGGGVTDGVSVSEILIGDWCTSLLSDGMDSCRGTVIYGHDMVGSRCLMCCCHAVLQEWIARIGLREWVSSRR